ncbi:hypothetical protein IV203_018429 [Nitzschia inconspicua]|uniref:Uncharacterized protein n=1 Tax=Nitzschia inconspicua TaxID=303405 RepID=A0A9K3M567_9STRA|nr:hypothetical protein IV203_018429 [Nitzschia inconspicua]
MQFGARFLLFVVSLSLTLLVTSVNCSIEKWSLTLLLECNNPHHPHRKLDAPNFVGQRGSIKTALSTQPSSFAWKSIPKTSGNSIHKNQLGHPTSSVFESRLEAPHLIVNSDSNNTFIQHHDADYHRRKQEWMARYTTLDGLRETFGGNRNKLWGDLDPVTTRKLYKSLLPTALCELVLDLGVPPEELAPLAYAARKAAKFYARERSRVPTRIAASAYDGFRQLKRYGKFQPSGMSYDQVWDKYRRQTFLETAASNTRNFASSEEELVARTCMKIIESSCRTNPRIDQLALRGGQKDSKLGRAEMMKIAKTLEDDVRRLLDPYSNHKP